MALGKICVPFLAVLCASIAFAAEPTTMPCGMDDAQVQREELNRLRLAELQRLRSAEIERLRLSRPDCLCPAYTPYYAAQYRPDEMERLRLLAEFHEREIAALRTQLQSLKVQPLPAPYAPQPAPRKPDGRVAFVLDVSGSMTDKLEAARQQISNAVGELSDKQMFSIVTCRDGEVLELSNLALAGDNPSKQRAYEFLSQIKCKGPDDVLEGMHRALRSKPDVIWLISDGDIYNAAHVLIEICRMNTIPPTRINTVLNYCSDESSALLLRQISAESGGICLDPLGRIVTPLCPADVLFIPSTQPAIRPNGATILHED